MNKIVYSGEYLLEEGKAYEAITPGQLIALKSDGTIYKFPNDGGVSEVLIAIENALYGKTIDDACSESDQIPYIIPQKGVVFYGWLKAGENASIGEFLVPYTGGIMRCNNSDDVGEMKFVALEAVNNTGATSVRIKVRVI